jgi:glycogen operon protein
MLPDIAWVDRTGKTPDWRSLNKFLAFYLDGDHIEIQSDRDDDDFLVLCNPDSKDISAALSVPPNGKSWYRRIDTSIQSPDDFLNEGSEEYLRQQKLYVLPARSMSVLVAK